ncbi:SusC/RagA family TonB-linked outer membrane protein, partial [Alistipes onderdonkii]
MEVSYLGYETLVVDVGNRTAFDLTLQESSAEIEQVVVTALGIKRSEKAVAYNVQQVKAEDLTTVKDANFINSLTGKVAGVTINTSSSGVGGASKVILRGNKSISQSSNALYVIDGIPMYNFGGGGGTEFDSRGATESIADINPEDIESMSVLTGAAAAALYGSEAANGAVMITTKKGQAGALKVTLSSNTEFLNPFVLPEFQNRYGTGLNGTRSGSGIYSWGEKLLPAARYGYTPNDYFETGHVYTNAVTVSGGTDKNQTYFSAASVNSDGIIPNNEYDRYNFTFRNTSYFLKDKLRLDASASYIYQKDQNMTNQGVYSNPLVPAYLFPRGENFDLYRRFERYNEGTKLMEQFWSTDMEGGDLRMQNPYWINYRNLRESIADINPEDIESMSVLTGAAAAALYGSEAANGAVMITTKKGQAGRLKATFSSNTEFLNPFVLPDFQNRYGTGLNGQRSGSSIYSWGEKLRREARYGYTPNDYFETGHVYTNAVTVSGGTDKNQTYFSAASVNSDGIIPNNEYDRYNFTFRNTSYFLKDRLKLDASASYIYQKDQNMTNQGVYSNPLVPAYLFPRGENFDLYRRFERYNEGTKLMEQFWSTDMEGGDLRMQNPYWINYRNLRNTDKKRYMLSFSASYDILPWLNVAGRVRLDNSNSLYTQKLYASSNTTITDGGKNGHYTEARAYDTQTYADLMVNINKTFGEDWSLNANIGASINNIKTDELSYRGPIQENGLPNVFNVFDLDDTKKRAEKTGWHDQTQSIFASVEVGWKQMLYLTVTGRNDWASQLANSPESSFFYPSVGLSWVPTATFNMPDAISYLKIRGSIASVGMPFPRHLTVPTYEYDATNKVWKDKTHYPIGDLKPERTITYEVGLDARLWQHINLSASWYRADTKNQTFDPSLPPSSSYTTIYLQTGHVRNTGVELSLGYDNQWRDFRWTTNFTYSWNKNEIRELAA